LQKIKNRRPQFQSSFFIPGYNIYIYIFNTPADKENVNGEENDQETSVVACSCGSDVLCSIYVEFESEEADVVEGEDKEAEKLRDATLTDIYI
jgi:hypothetical protein